MPREEERDGEPELPRLDLHLWVRGAPTGLGDPRGPRVRIYHFCDDGVVSTRRLAEVLAEGMAKRARLMSLPRMLALTAATLLGKGAQVRRLYGNLEVDGSDFCRDYAWQPPLSLEDGLREIAGSFVADKRG